MARDVRSQSRGTPEAGEPGRRLACGGERAPPPGMRAATESTEYPYTAVAGSGAVFFSYGLILYYPPQIPVTRQSHTPMSRARGEMRDG